MKKKQKSIQKYDRHSIIELNSIDGSNIITLIKQTGNSDDKNHRLLINSISINASSLRLRTFAEKGTTCKCCGLEATHLAIERDMAMSAKDGGYHLNLWGVKDSEEVLFTHDHILARCLGGKDHISNTQTMCCYCNWDKGDQEAILASNSKEKK